MIEDLMKRLAMLCLLVVLGVVTWVVGTRISEDALAMAVGVCFGVMASIPTSLLIVAAARRERERDSGCEDRRPRDAARRLSVVNPETGEVVNVRVRDPHGDGRHLVVVGREEEGNG